MEKNSREDCTPFVTKDRSIIRSLMDASNAPVEKCSLAEATVPVGGETVAHIHRGTEEIYYFVEGRGRMRLGGEETPVERGDSVLIPPGTEHKLWNTGGRPLVLLCVCAPPYSDQDTDLVAEGERDG